MRKLFAENDWLTKLSPKAKWNCYPFLYQLIKELMLYAVYVLKHYAARSIKMERKHFSTRL